MLLAIDTATRLISLAVRDDYDLLAENTWHTANNHTIELAPALRVMLERCEIAVGDLTAVAVSIGPGSFTGVRIGVAMAKGLALTQQIPLVGVSTLDILAAGQPAYQRHALICVVEAGRGRIIASTYRWGRSQWVNRGEPRLMTWDTLLDTIDGPAYIAGDISATGREQLAAAQAADLPVKVSAAGLRLRRAGFLAEVAAERLAQAAADHFDPRYVVPVYVHTRDIP
jgi:tRNA threonylcarbamoyladenosine biosynthesis protein TsaB